MIIYADLVSVASLSTTLGSSLISSTFASSTLLNASRSLIILSSCKYLVEAGITFIPCLIIILSDKQTRSTLLSSKVLILSLSSLSTVATFHGFTEFLFFRVMEKLRYFLLFSFERLFSPLMQDACNKLEKYHIAFLTEKNTP